MCHIQNHNDVAQKLKEIADSHRTKIELEKKHLNQQMVQSMQGLRNVNKYHSYHMPRITLSVMKSTVKYMS